MSLVNVLKQISCRKRKFNVQGYLLFSILLIAFQVTFSVGCSDTVDQADKNNKPKSAAGNNWDEMKWDEGKWE